VQHFPMSLAVVSSGVWSYYLKYHFSDRVPTGYEVVGCAAKANPSSSKLLREVFSEMCLPMKEK